MIPFLFKILSFDDWYESQSLENLKLSKMDDEFIHLAEENQLPQILEKFWGTQKQYVILKLNPSKLSGNLVKEKNPGGHTEYYHLYNGSIPLDSVIEAKSSI